MTNRDREQRENEFDPESYWDTRLSRMKNVRGTGHRQFSVAYNEAMYRVATQRLRAALDKAGIDLAGKQVLDVGAGLGYFLRHYILWGAAHVTGLDITPTSVQLLTQEFPEHKFVQGDISSSNLSLNDDYDLVSVLNVIYHIVDDLKFDKAIENICLRVRPGGHLVLGDSFTKSLFPTARHTRLRSLNSYTPHLDRHGFEILMIRPMFYVMGRSFLPVLGPRVFSLSPLVDLISSFEIWLGDKIESNFDGPKILIAKRADSDQV